MKFKVLDQQMRQYETTNDLVVMPDIYMVARIDGRGFTKLTKETHTFNAPFDKTFSDYMLQTTQHLMHCGFKVTYAYTQSDEISLLLDLQENAFGRKLRKLNSILAGEASAKFSLLLGDIGVFDCRICQLPNIAKVVDYFRWRNEDAHRNALNAYCYWKLREQNQTAFDANQKIKGLTTAQKNELLFQLGINYNEVPNWQKRGIGLYWEAYQTEGVNPILQETILVSRKQIVVEKNLPMKEAYSNFLGKLFTHHEVIS